MRSTFTIIVFLSSKASGSRHILSVDHHKTETVEHETHHGDEHHHDEMYEASHSSRSRHHQSSRSHEHEGSSDDREGLNSGLEGMADSVNIRNGRHLYEHTTGYNHNAMRTVRGSGSRTVEASDSGDAAILDKSTNQQMLNMDTNAADSLIAGERSSGYVNGESSTQEVASNIAPSESKSETREGSVELQASRNTQSTYSDDAVTGSSEVVDTDSRSSSAEERSGYDNLSESTGGKEDDAEIVDSILYRQSKFAENVGEYFRRLEVIGITAAAAAAHVQVLASLAELAERVLSQLEALAASRKDTDSMIRLTLKRLTEVVTTDDDSTADESIEGSSERQDTARVLVQDADSSSSSSSSSRWNDSKSTSAASRPKKPAPSRSKTTTVKKSTYKVSIDFKNLAEGINTLKDSVGKSKAEETETSQAADQNDASVNAQTQQAVHQPVYQVAAVHPCTVCTQHSAPHYVYDAQSQGAYYHGYSTR